MMKKMRVWGSQWISKDGRDCCLGGGEASTKKECTQLARLSKPPGKRGQWKLQYITREFWECSDGIYRPPLQYKTFEEGFKAGSKG